MSSTDATSGGDELRTPRFAVDARIEHARTLPGRFYTDPLVHELVRERVFADAWHWIGDAHELEPRACRPFVLLEGLLDEPLVATRDEHGVLRVLSNVCTHRGNLVATRACSTPALACGYHGRRFELDGRLRHAPEFEGAHDFPCASDDLASLPLARLGDLSFVSLRPARPFDVHVGDLLERLAWLPTTNLRRDPSRARVFTFDAHWALYCDNYLEGFHVPWVHPSLNAAIEFESYTTELFRHASLQIAHAAPGVDAFDPPPSSRDHGRRIAAYYAFVYPNLMLNWYPWGLSINVVEPLGPTRTRVRFESFVADATRLEQGAGGALDQVEAEDEAIVCAVQRGVRSRLFTQGRYSPTRERGVHHFHRLLAHALG